MDEKNISQGKKIVKPANEYRHPKTDLVGQRFGRLVVKEFAGRDRWYVALWLCLCDCGNNRIVNDANLKTGHTQSCGCYRKQKISEIHTIHGAAKRNKPTRTYNIFYDMLKRCYNPKYSRYKDYGGRGIYVCDEWRSFPVFRDWFESHVAEGQQLDRIDNNGPYAPWNCRGATREEQARNTRRNINITWEGETLCLKDWAEKLKINVETLRARIRLLNWPIEKALTTPAMNRGRHQHTRESTAL